MKKILYLYPVSAHSSLTTFHYLRSLKFSMKSRCRRLTSVITIFRDASHACFLRRPQQLCIRHRHLIDQPGTKDQPVNYTRSHQTMLSEFVLSDSAYTVDEMRKILPDWTSILSSLSICLPLCLVIYIYVYPALCRTGGQNWRIPTTRL